MCHVILHNLSFDTKLLSGTKEFLGIVYERTNQSSANQGGESINHRAKINRRSADDLMFDCVVKWKCLVARKRELIL